MCILYGLPSSVECFDIQHYSSIIMSTVQHQQVRFHGLARTSRAACGHPNKQERYRFSRSSGHGG